MYLTLLGVSDDAIRYLCTAGAIVGVAATLAFAHAIEQWANRPRSK